MMGKLQPKGLSAAVTAMSREEYRKIRGAAA
jgi:hypothetical protein